MSIRMAQNISHPAQSAGCSHWLAALTGLLALVQVGAALHALQIRPELAAQVSLSMPLEIAASLIWALLSAVVTFALLRRQPRAIHYTAWLLIGFTVYSLGRLALLAQADYDRQRLPFLAVASLVLLLIPTAYVVRPPRAATQPTENHGDGR
jgi:hypothetical protein